MENIEEEKKQGKKDYFLPISIVLAAIVVAIALIYSSGVKTLDNNGNNVLGGSNEIGLFEEDYILGEKDAEFTIFEFSDYECPYCAKLHTTSLQSIIEDYVKTGEAKLVFRSMLFHEDSRMISNAVLCAGDQDKYWEMQESVFEGESVGLEFDESKLIELAIGVGLDRDKFVECFELEKNIASAERSTQLGQEAGIGVTPTLVIVKTESLPLNIDGNYIASEIQNALSSKTGSPIINFDGGVLIVGAQTFNVFKQEIDKLIK